MAEITIRFDAYAQKWQVNIHWGDNLFDGSFDTIKEALDWVDERIHRN